MAQFRITAPDGTVYNVTGPDGATEQDALAQVQAQHQAAAPAAAAPSVGTRINQVLEGVNQGIYALPQHAIELGARGLDALGVTDHAYDNTKAAFDQTNAGALDSPADAQSKYFQRGNAAGAVASSLPLAAVNPVGGAGVLPAAANGALQGGAAGLLDSRPGNTAADTGIGAAIGAGVNGLTHGAANMLTPVIRPAVQALAEQGVTLTPGSIFGGVAKRVEDGLAGVPIAGDPIIAAKQQSLRDFGTGAGNIVLGGIGPLPAGISGQPMSTTAHQIFDDAYGQILPQLSVTLGPELSNAVASNGARVAARLPDGTANTYDSTIADAFKKLAPTANGPSNTFPGQAVKDVYSDLGSEARRLQTPTATPNDRALGQAYGNVQEGLRQSFQNSDPWAAASLQNIDSAYRNFIPVDAAITKASGNAGGLEAGVFTPQQLRQAAVQADNSVRKVASAQGGSPLQQYAENGIEVLPSSIPDSGTAGRLGLLEMIAHPHWVLPAAATRAVYNRPVIDMLNRNYANGPSAAVQNLADIFRNLGGALTAPAATAATGGGQ